jgi:hypothetical protein
MLVPLVSPILAFASDNFGGCGVGVLVVLVIGVGFLVSHAQKKSRADVMAGLASKWNGEAHPGDLFTNPSLRVRIDNVDGEVTFREGGKNRSPWTHVHFDWPCPQRLRVTPEGIGSMFKSMAGSSEIKVGDVAFDALCWIETSDRAWACEVLASDVRQAILRLNDETPWYRSGSFTLDLGSAGIRFRVSRLLADDAAALERFVDAAILILKRARSGGADSGVIFAAVEAKSDSECPVCGHSVATSKKDCPECRTPHHLDCWSYSAGCAIFGCPARSKKAA